MNENNIKETIANFTKTLPPTIDIIGYGSAVKTQKDNNDKVVKQIDIIATVKDSTTWHNLNRSNNPTEYSILSYLTLRPLLHKVTDINYISDIPFDKYFFKIGIIDKFDLIYDLNNWNNFYMAGRTQKPVLVVKGDEELEISIKKNRLNALRTTLILSQDKKITEKELFELLCSLSYIDDIRMDFKMENPHKISNIVNGEYEEFVKIYSELNNDLYEIKNDIIVPNKDKLIDEVNDLPPYLLEYLSYNININNMNKEKLLELKEYIYKYLKSKNLKASIMQPIKSASINNMKNNLKYAYAKKKKYINNKAKAL